MDPLVHKRQQILQQMEQIERMERGSLQAETRPSKRESAQECGPYHKYQVWEDGHNLTRRVPQEQAEPLAEAIAGRKEFEKLAEQFIDTTVAMTHSEPSAKSKKNGTRSNPLSKRRPPDTSKSS